MRRMRHLFRLLRRGLAGLAGLVLLLSALLAAALWATLPAEEEEAAIPGLFAPVAIGLDSHGIPRILAASEADAARALGWLHARDRMFQMEMMRRGGAGRLAEILGPSALRLDRFVRTLGLARAAEADLAALPGEVRAILEAYAEGVNARIAARGRWIAPEFLALGPPEPWRPADSLLWGKVMGLWLSANWREELERARLAALLPPERIAELWPEDASAGRPDGGASLDPARVAALLSALPRFPEDGTLPPSASNAWALAPSRSASGGALLASDPHLGFSAPILWYLARIELPGGRFLAGATAPGVPMVVIGRNERLAWGFTTTHADTQDVVVERLAGPNTYETEDGPRPFALREERIRVRFGAEEVLRVRETRHGPVVSDLEPGAPAGSVLAVAMTVLAPNDTAAAGLFALNRARSIAEARAAAALISAPSQNLVVADAEGGIALYIGGRIPLRRTGDGAWPAKGAAGPVWRGFLPFDALPHVENPASGLVLNANNRVVPPGHPAFLGRDWHGDWRFRRILELLPGADTPAAQAGIQADAVSLLARELLPLLRRLPRPAGTAGEAFDLLSAWQGEMAAGLPQPLVFHAWLSALGRAALEAGGVPPGAAPARPEFLRHVFAEGRGAHWCGEQGCEALAARAFAEGVASLAARFGADPARWRWGDAHRARFLHPLLRFVPILGPWLGAEVPTPGDGQTVNRGGMAADFSHIHGPGLRLVADLSSPDGLWAIIATGQSGHPMSRHWLDLTGRWAAGGLLQLGAAADHEAGSILLLPPR
ncbi:MAG: penicillin acylase family protein [Acetobacteraceae bacterium]|nr:penicillin acylase family protein [Acetobacteraceae bacterium]